MLHFRPYSWSPPNHPQLCVTRTRMRLIWTIFSLAVSSKTPTIVSRPLTFWKFVFFTYFFVFTVHWSDVHRTQCGIKNTVFVTETSSFHDSNSKQVHLFTNSCMYTLLSLSHKNIFLRSRFPYSVFTVFIDFLSIIACCIAAPVHPPSPVLFDSVILNWGSSADCHREVVVSEREQQRAGGGYLEI